MIAFSCVSCQKKLSVKEEGAGKKVICPGCGHVMTVPAAAATLESAAGPSPELWNFLAPAQQAEEIGRLGPYRILQVLGAGGMGVVFLAEDMGLRRLVALKAMLPALASSAAAKERFFREARAAAALKHPHIVTIHQVAEDRGAPYLAMEYLEGESLDGRLKRQPPVSIAEVLRIGWEVAEGLSCAHAKGLIHRDIKPANIWLEGDKGLVKILDFGLARALDDQTHLTQSGAIVGTPAYMAPEQACGQAVDPRCDLFSLGCVLYRLTTGRLPFQGDNTLNLLSALANDTPPEPASLNPAIPPELNDLIVKLLAKKPEDRPGSAQEVAAALRALEHDAQGTQLLEDLRRRRVQPPRPGPGVRPGAKKSRLPLLLGIAGALVAVLALVLLLWWRTPPGTVGSVPNGQAKASPDIPLPARFTNRLGMVFALVPKGKSWLGGEAGKVGTKEVEIRQDFYLGVYEVTQKEWEKVMDKNPSSFKAVAGVTKADQKRFPVENVSWEDAQAFVKLLNEQVKEAGWEYRLPTEEEWEYACRGGPMADKADSAFDYYFAQPTNELRAEQANFKDCDLKRTCKVGSYAPNRLGLHDMHGNVREWCADEVKAADGASRRVSRGGGWHGTSVFCRAAGRNVLTPSDRDRSLGVRLVRVPSAKK